MNRINSNNRTFGLEFELGYNSESSFIHLIIDNIHSLEQYRDYEYDDDEELNAEDPSREKRVKDLYKLVLSKKHPNSQYYTDFYYFTSNFLQKYYYFRGFPNPEEPSSDDIMKAILNGRGFKNWDVHYDGSIKNLKLAMEIVTPPLMYGSDSLNQVANFCNWIQKYATVNQSTGLHCHVDAKEFKQVPAKFTERLVLALFHYGSLEPVFDNLVMAHRRGNEAYYAKSVTKIDSLLYFYRDLIETKETSFERIIQLFQNSRYYKLNLNSLTKHGTLEFRQMHGTLNPTLVKNWVTVCVNFVSMILETEHLFLDLFNKLNKEIEAKREGINSLPREQLDHLLQSEFSYYSEYVSGNIRRAFGEAFYGTNIFSYIVDILHTHKFVSYGGYSAKEEAYKWTIDLSKVYEIATQAAQKQPVSGEIQRTKIEPSYPYISKRVKDVMVKYFSHSYGADSGIIVTSEVVSASNNSKNFIEDPSKIVVLISEQSLNENFDRQSFINDLSKDSSQPAYKSVAQDFKQTQYALAKNTPGINKSRAMAQVKQQTARRPLAEDYLDEIEL